MSIIRSYLSSSFSDSMIPHLRGGVEDLFSEVMEKKGIPSREEFRELRNRLDMLDYRTREVTKATNGLKDALSGVPGVSTGADGE